MYREFFGKLLSKMKRSQRVITIPHTSATANPGHGPAGQGFLHRKHFYNVAELCCLKNLRHIIAHNFFPKGPILTFFSPNDLSLKVFNFPAATLCGIHWRIWTPGALGPRERWLPAGCPLVARNDIQLLTSVYLGNCWGQ